jgi:hypothetical protein
MAGPVLVIHDFTLEQQDVDDRHEDDHDTGVGGR